MILSPELRLLDGGSASVGEAVRALRAQCTLAELREAVDTVLLFVGNVLRAPKDTRMWRVRCANPGFRRRVNRFPGGSGGVRGRRDSAPPAVGARGAGVVRGLFSADCTRRRSPLHAALLGGDYVMSVGGV